jgi:hypothetical protein
VTTFKQFLLEGGAATAAHHTERATKTDIEAALRFVSKHTGISLDTLKDNLLGSTRQTLSGQKKDSGDVDIAIETDGNDVEKMVEKMRLATKMGKVKRTGEGIYSFAVPTINDKKVQVDLMLVPSAKWARFGFHSEPTSKHKGAVRNLLLVNLMKRIFEKDKDFVIKDEAGKEVIRVRRGFTMDAGIKRTFRLAPMRKDGKGRVAGMAKVTPDEIETELKRLGIKKTFSKDADPILDPDKAATFMFGQGVLAKHIMSAEQVIALIAKRPDSDAIFKGAIADFKKSGLDIPQELKHLE